MHLVAHRLDNDSVDGVVMALAGRLEDVQARDVALLSLLAHGQQLIGETTHGRNHHKDGLGLGIDDIPKVE